MSEYKQYLGDSVYVDWDGGVITLSTENGYGPTNIIYLEPGVYDALKEYVTWLAKKIQAEGQI